MRNSVAALVGVLMFAASTLAEDQVFNWVKVTDKAGWTPRDSQGEVVYKDQLWIFVTRCSDPVILRRQRAHLFQLDSFQTSKELLANFAYTPTLLIRHALLSKLTFLADHAQAESYQHYRRDDNGD